MAHIHIGPYVLVTRTASNGKIAWQLWSDGKLVRWGLHTRNQFKTMRNSIDDYIKSQEDK